MATDHAIKRFLAAIVSKSMDNDGRADSLDFDRDVYLIPTVAFNGKTLVDWQFYYKLRKKFGKTLQRITEHFDRGLGIEIAAPMMEILAGGSELLAGSVSKVFETLSIISILDSRKKIFRSFVAVPAVDFVCDMALLRVNRGEMDWFKSVIMLLDHLVGFDKPKAKLFSFCKRTYDLCQLIRDLEPKITPLLRIIAQLFKTMPSFDERSKRLFELVTEYIIKLGPLDLGLLEDTDLEFQHPFASPVDRMILKQFAKIKESHDITVDVASRVYHSSDDWTIKASAIAVGWNQFNKTKEYCDKYYLLAVHAVQQTEHQQLEFSGLVGLYNLVKKSENCETHFNGEQATTLFDIFTNALTRYDAPHMGLKFYHVLLRILPAVQPDLISDELLDQFIANVLSVFARQGDVAQKEDDFVYAFSQVGSKFKGRLANKLDQVKAVLFNMEAARFKPDRLLECYVNLGVAVQENEFAAEFKILAKQIADGTLPLKVPILKCYGRFADVWIRFAESEDEREGVIKALLEAIPKGVSEFGQSGIFSEEEKQPEVGPERFPNTREEMRAEYEANDMQKITIPVLHRTPKHCVPKELLTRVNPSGTIRPDNGELIKGDISRSHLYASQLLMLVIGDDGRFAKHAQSVLNAMLATYRVGFNVVNLHHTILGLLALVRPEMESSEFIKYIDIVLHTMAHEINTEQPMHEAVKSGLSDLFAFCFSLLEGLGVMKASTIKNTIDVYLLIYDFADPRFFDIHELTFYLITTWPRNAYEGIRQSNLADWLLFRIKKAKSQEHMAPCLYVFATCAVFYGIDFISMELCVDDPNEDEFESSDQYLARIMPYCRALYVDASKSDIDSRWMDKFMYVKFMRNFLILYAIYLVHNHSGEISLLTKVEEYDSDVLKIVIASEKSFDTGVPELNEYFRGLDLDGLCKALSLKRVVYSDEEDEPEDNVKEENNDVEINDE